MGVFENLEYLNAAAKRDILLQGLVGLESQS
jgi:hypothetical protein